MQHQQSPHMSQKDHTELREPAALKREASRKPAWPLHLLCVVWLLWLLMSLLWGEQGLSLMSSEVGSSNSSLASSKSARHVTLLASCQQPGSPENWRCWHLAWFVGNIKQTALPLPPGGSYTIHLLAKGEKEGSVLVVSTITCVCILCSCSLMLSHGVCLVLWPGLWFLSVGAMLILCSLWCLPHTTVQTSGMRYSIFRLRKYMGAAF